MASKNHEAAELLHGLVASYPPGSKERMALLIGATALASEPATQSPELVDSPAFTGYTLYRLTHMKSALDFDRKAIEDAITLIKDKQARQLGYARILRLLQSMLAAATPFVGDLAMDEELHTRLREVLREGMEPDVPLLPSDWQDRILATIKRLGLCTPEVMAHAIANDLREAAPKTLLSSKPFPAPGAWYPIDVLGNPMREITPNAWESWTRPHPLPPAAPTES